jgi:hypothetical protein
MPFHRLPDHIRKHPDVQDAWHHHHAERIDKIESHQSKNDGLGHLTHALFAGKVKTPWGDLPLPLAIIAAGYTIYKNPDLLLGLFGP